ncbi:hypothetical protein NL676_027287 [Syzygium grande]|nr:hypothetical protein NL676_027287 [Syzygium grande]
MVGGAAMRSAASKIAGIVGVLRGSPASPAPPRSVPSASRSAGGVPAIVSARGAGDVPRATTAQMLAREADDRDFAGFDGEPVGQPMARVVFGGAPSYEEATAATAELTDAIDRVYLSSTNTTGYEDQLPADQASVLPLISNSVEIQSSITSEALATYPAPIQALTLLSQCPAAQGVVASIASDPNVWNAFMQNGALNDFLQSQNSSIQFPYMEPRVEESADDALSDDGILSMNVEEISEGGHENELMTILQNIKLTVEEMVSNVSSFLANILSPPPVENSSTNSKGNAGPAPGASVMWLALMAIIVVLIRRG